jgi:hypothetical protein
MDEEHLSKASIKIYFMNIELKKLQQDGQGDSSESQVTSSQYGEKKVHGCLK